MPAIRTLGRKLRYKSINRAKSGPDLPEYNSPKKTVSYSKLRIYFYEGTISLNSNSVQEKSNTEMQEEI